MKKVRLSLHLGDARETRTLVAIMGFRNALKPEIENTAKSKFTPFSLPGTKVRGEVLTSNSNMTWRHTLAIKMQFKQDIYEQPSDILSTTMAYAYHVLRMPSITILPLSWRYPERAAASTLFAIWMLAYYSESLLKTSNFPLSIILCDKNTLQPYEDLLDNNGEKLWKYIEAIHGQTFTIFPKEMLRRDEVVFDVRTS